MSEEQLGNLTKWICAAGADKGGLSGAESMNNDDLLPETWDLTGGLLSDPLGLFCHLEDLKQNLVLFLPGNS